MYKTIKMRLISIEREDHVFTDIISNEASFALFI